jgi:dTDP-4-dehydrorhamnose reductase
MDTVGPILITGAAGILGSALSSLCGEMSERCFAHSEADLDITDDDAVQVAISRFALASGRLVINTAAYTDVERAEDDEMRASAVNDRGARNVAEAAAQYGLGLAHVSTDFVFDGKKNGPYTEEDEPNPLNAYGRSKLAGELSVADACPDALIVRTAWVYGPGGADFPSKILQLARRREELEVVDDELGSPTASADLARGILELCRRRASGVFHLAGSGWCSRYEMAQEIIAVANLSTRLVPVGRGVFSTKAIRPANSVLSVEKASRLGVELPPWQDSLRNYVQHHLLKAA